MDLKRTENRKSNLKNSEDFKWMNRMLMCDTFRVVWVSGRSGHVVWIVSHSVNTKIGSKVGVG